MVRIISEDPVYLYPRAREWVRQVIGLLPQDYEELLRGDSLRHLMIGACKNGNESLCQDLLEKQVPLQPSPIERYTPLHTAIIEGNVNIVRLLLQAGASPGNVPGLPRSPLEEAVIANQAEIIDLLIDAGACINQQNAGAETPLLVSCIFGHVKPEIVLALARRGADPLIEDTAGNAWFYLDENYMSMDLDFKKKVRAKLAALKSGMAQWEAIQIEKATPHVACMNKSVRL